jgi:hypothetical protein
MGFLRRGKRGLRHLGSRMSLGDTEECRTVLETKEVLNNFWRVVVDLNLLSL